MRRTGARKRVTATSAQIARRRKRRLPLHDAHDQSGRAASMGRQGTLGVEKVGSHGPQLRHSEASRRSYRRRAEDLLDVATRFAICSSPHSARATRDLARQPDHRDGARAAVWVTGKARTDLSVHARRAQADAPASSNHRRLQPVAVPVIGRRKPSATPSRDLHSGMADVAALTGDKVRQGARGDLDRHHRAKLTSRAESARAAAGSIRAAVSAAQHDGA